jgi:hypothetical protein
MVEERAMPAAHCMLLGMSWSICRLVLFKLGLHVGNKPRTRNGPRANCRADQKCAASCIMLGHAIRLPLRQEPGRPGWLSNWREQ